MSRYNNTGGGNGNGNNYDNDIELKLQKYAAIRMDGDRVNAFNGNWGDKFIAGFDNVSVIDGIVFQRDDKPGTWKVFSADKFFNLNPNDGLVYEDHSDGEYSNQMDAEEMLEHPRILGFSETFGGDDYYYTPVGVVIEEAEDVALNEDVIGEENGLTEDDAEIARQDIEIPVGKISMLLNNQSWTRTLAKKLTVRGEDIINDNGADDPDNNPKYDNFDWLTTLDPEIRDDLEGRTMELWVTEETREYDDGETTFTQPNLLDVKTSTPDNMNFVTINNGVEDDDDGRTNHESGQDAAQDHDEPAADPEPKAAADGGTAVQESSESTDDSSDSSDSNDSSASSSDGLPDDVPDVLDDLLDYFARTQGEATAEELEEFAEDEVEDPESVDWEAAAAEVEARE